MAKSSGAMRRSSPAIVTDAQNKTASRIARQTRDLKNEQYRIINEDGAVVLEKRGGRGEVASTAGEKREYLDGALSIHNHPDGGTFSDADLRDFGYGARAIVVSSPEGTYRLTNVRYGTPQAHSGWHDMQQAMDAAGVTRERGFRELRDEAQKDRTVAKHSAAMQKAAEAWTKAKDAGKPKETLDKITERYNAHREQYRTALKAAERQVAVKPYDDFYRKNAAKYGFKYEFVKR